MDWEPPHKWLHDPNTRVFLAWHKGILQGVMAFSPPQSNTCWLRLLMLPHENDINIFQALWELAQTQLHPDLQLIGAMPTRHELIPLLEAIGFREIEQVVHLERYAQALAPLPAPSAITLKRVQWNQFRSLVQIDHQAFQQGLWQLRESELREAQQHAYRYMVAWIGREMVGYQITMRYGRTLHLSRLAVHPRHQHQQVGTTLLLDLLTQAEKGQIETVTVNTQVHNIHSRRLYERWGFIYDDYITTIYGFWRSDQK